MHGDQDEQPADSQQESVPLQDQPDAGEGGQSARFKTEAAEGKDPTPKGADYS